MDPNEIKHIVTELIESGVRHDNERLIGMNRELIRQNERQRDAIRRLQTVQRIQAQQIDTLQNNITHYQHWEQIHYAVIREYFVNNEEARISWEDSFSFHDETYDEAIRDHETYGIMYDGHHELEETEMDEEMLELLAADTEEEEDQENPIWV